MKIQMHTRLPILAVLACAAITLTVSSVAAYAAGDAASSTSQPQPQQDNDNGSFRGLMPPAASNVDTSDADTSNADTGEGKPTIQYGAPEPDNADTYPPLTLTPDKAELVHLDGNAATVITGSPDNLNIQMESRNLMVLTPAKPGATYLTVLDARGHVIMQRHVIVGGPKASYIRIRRSCAGQSNGCQPTSIYYCDGMCHAVGGSTAMPSSGGTSSGGGSGGYAGGGYGGGSNMPPMTQADVPTAKTNLNQVAPIVPGY